MAPSDSMSNTAIERNLLPGNEAQSEVDSRKRDRGDFSPTAGIASERDRDGTGESDEVYPDCF